MRGTNCFFFLNRAENVVQNLHCGQEAPRSHYSDVGESKAVQARRTCDLGGIIARVQMGLGIETFAPRAKIAIGSGRCRNTLGACVLVRCDDRRRYKCRNFDSPLKGVVRQRRENCLSPR